MEYSKKIEILGKICTRDESGRHFTQRYSDADLRELEAEGLISIYRPVHDTGISYSQEYYQVEVTADGIAEVEAAA